MPRTRLGMQNLIRGTGGMKNSERTALLQARQEKRRKALAEQKRQSDRQFLLTGAYEDATQESASRSTDDMNASTVEIQQKNGRSNESQIANDGRDAIRKERRLRERPRRAVAEQHKQKRLASEKQDLKNAEFLDDFDPERSGREMRKIKRKVYAENRKIKQTKYDGKGLTESGLDLCDCCDRHCPGCHLPCPRCKSCKCGLDCRNNRRYVYKEVEVEGTGELYCFRG